MSENIKQIIDSKKILQGLLRTLMTKETLVEDDLNLVLDMTVQRIVEILNIEAISVYFVDSDNMIKFTNVYYSPYLWKANPEKEKEFKEKTAKLLGVKIKMGEGRVGKVIKDMQPDIMNDAALGETGKRISQSVNFVIKNMLTIPIILDGKGIGALQLLNKMSKKDNTYQNFVEDDARIIGEVARYCAKLIERIKFPDRKLKEDEMIEIVAKLSGTRVVRLGIDKEPDSKLIETIGEEVIKELRIVPLEKTSTTGVSVVMSDPWDIYKRDNFEIRTRLVIDKVFVCPESLIKKYIEKTFTRGEFASLSEKITAEYGGIETIQIDENVDENSSPVVQLCNNIIEDAYLRGASDIHIEPREKETIVRYRIDGYLKEILKLPVTVHKAVVSRYKIMSNLDIAEKRLPQDGRIAFKNYSRKGINIDLRLSTTPILFGEKIVMRILDKSSSLLSLEQMGFSEHNLKIYREALAKPYGMILHTGPTGSGKTTTLYAALSAINTPDINIQTAEDPVEYTLPGVNQLQVNKEIGLTFAAALRSFLRQDPDVILVGEIRDKETATIAVEAALTGHLLFSTLHTNDAPGTITRLEEMGIEPFLVSASLVCICAQRLARRLCSKCKVAVQPTKEELELLGLENGNIKIYKPKGCSYCNDTGYKGRIGIHEILLVTPPLRTLISKGGNTDQLREAAIKEGMITLFKDAMQKVIEGITSIEEALTVVRED
ncbi:MAG: ATPase, T2SS/T4P/T4SS family [Planctomycetota bacterium]